MKKEKIIVTLDVTKIDKSKIVERVYTNKNGEEVRQKLYKLEVIPTNDEKLVKAGDTWKLIKTHFVAESVSKEDKANGIKGNILGDGVVFRNHEHGVDMGEEAEVPPLKPDSIPF